MNQYLVDKQDKVIDYVEFRVHLYEQKVSKTSTEIVFVNSWLQFGIKVSSYASRMSKAKIQLCQFLNQLSNSDFTIDVPISARHCQYTLAWPGTDRINLSLSELLAIN